MEERKGRKSNCFFHAMFQEENEIKEKKEKIGGGGDG